MRSYRRARRGAALLAGVSGLALLLAAAPALAATTIDNGTQTVPTDHPSPWNIDTGLSIGPSGTGELDIINGGDAVTTNATCGTIFIGFNASGKGTLKVDGAGSTLDNASCSLLGGFSGQATVTVTNGGVLTTGLGNNGNVLASGTGSSALVTIDGTGSAWNYTGLVTGNGQATINVTNGGLLNQTNCVNNTLGSGSAGKGTINVSGAGSHWGNSGSGNCGVYVGADGEGVINVTAGGKVDGVLQFVLGQNFGPAKGTITIDGAGSSASSGGLIVGNGQNSTGVISITNGGVLSTTNGGTVGAGSGSTGTVTVDGAGSQWNSSNGNVGIGNGGAGTLTITNGGVVSGSSGYVGAGAGASSASVSGVGSKWTSTGNLQIGAANATGTLTVSSGGLVTSGSATVGQGNNSIATVTVTGAGSKWTNTGNFSLSGSTNSNTAVNILAGGLLSNVAGDIQRGTLTVDGAGSSWTSTGNVRVGSSAVGNLIVSNGGAVNAGANTITLGQGSSSGGQLWIGSGSGQSAAAPGTVQASSIVLGAANGAQGFVIFKHTSSNYTFSTPMSGPGVVQLFAGTTVLTGANTYTGVTLVSGTGVNPGVLVLNGSLAATAMTVNSDGTLTGSGSTAGTVAVSNGTLKGTSGQTLTMGSLSLASNSFVDITLGAPSATKLFQVNGGLTLDGSLIVHDAGGFGPGVYRLFDYTGSLSDNGLNITTLPAGVDPSKLSIQTGIAGQVNLAFSSAGALQYWNGAVTSPNGSVNGGAGTWNATTTNWTNAGGNATAAWGIDGFAIFQGTAGTVSVSNAGGTISANGLQFAVGGYTVGGETLTLTGGSPIIRVGDGTAGGSAMTATVNTVLAGSSGLAKTDLGKLVLGGTNTYTGGTTLSGGTLQIASDANLGGAGGLTLAGGTLAITGATSSSRAITVSNATANTIDNSAAVTLSGVMTGGGSLTKIGAGQLTFSGSGGYSGGIFVNGGTFRLNGTLSQSTIQVQTGATVTGSGTLGGPLYLFNNATLALQSGQTLTTGHLTFNQDSVITASLGAPSNTTLVQVNGDLNLNGKLTVTSSGGFGPGLYRLMNYTGTLTDNTLDVVSAPAGTPAGALSVQTSVAGQVNLVYDVGAFSFWNGSTTAADGTIHGGSGTWNTTATNWTNATGQFSGPWDGTLGVFAAPGGTVTIDNTGGAVGADSLQFAANGYTVGGGVLTLTGPSPTIRVGDGTAGGAAMTTTINSVIAGGSGLRKTDLGTLVLTGANTFTGVLQVLGGTVQVGADANLGGAGQSVVMNGGGLRVTGSFATSRNVGANPGGGFLDVAGGQALTLNGAFGTLGAFDKRGGGQLTLNGAGGFQAPATVSAGTLAINNTLTGAGLTVQTGGVLTGTGSLSGLTSVTDGVLKGQAGQTLTLGGLSLTSASAIDVTLGAPSTTRLFQVNGNLTLDGTLNVTGAGGFGPGLYRLIDYTGTLTDNGLALGAAPAAATGSLTIQTSQAGQVNLIYAAPTTSFWNGSHTTPTGQVEGGTGTWKLGTNNWTTAAGDVSGSYTNGGTAIFMGSPAPVTIDNSGGAISVSTLQFAEEGYGVTGDTLTLTGASIIRVGDGTALSPYIVAVIDAPIAGSNGLHKTDLGALVLLGPNPFTGGLDIQGGLLGVYNDGAMGAAGGGVTLAGGRLLINDTFSSSRTVTVTASSGLDVVSGETFTFNGALEGTGNLSITRGGEVVFNGGGAYSGVLTVSNGVLEVDGAFSGSVNVGAGGVLGGIGSIAGPVTVDGAIGQVSGFTLDTGDLTLTSNAAVFAALGAPTNVALFDVHGALTLDGTLNVADAGGFGIGVYRLFDYSGGLTDNGMVIGLSGGAPAGSLAIQTAVAGQVNLVYSAAAPIQFWNGTHTTPNGQVNGGAGTWRIGDTNWTDANGASSSAWAGQNAVFMGPGGVVTIDNSGGQVGANSLQFAAGGYSVAGGALSLTGAAPTIRVGDGSAGGAGYSTTVGAALTGNSGLAKTDLGTLVLTGTNTFTGGLSIQGGTVSVGADANLGAASGAVGFDGGNLTVTGGFTTGRTFNVNSDATITTGAGVVLDLTGTTGGSATLTKAGAGRLALSGSGFAGGVTVNAGTLSVNTTVAGAANVNGGRLQGVGSVGSLTVNSGGVAAPGNSIGTLNVAGPVSFSAGSVYEVELNAAGASDRIAATGAATINGGTVNAIAAPGLYQLGTRYTILTAAGGRTGAFTGLTQSGITQPFLQLSMALGPTQVYLDVTRNSATYCSVAATANQCAAANGAESLGQGNSVYNAIANLPDAASARLAFDGLSGEVYGSVRGVLTEDSRFVREAALGRGAGGNDGRAVWGQVFGAQGDRDGDGNAADLKRTTDGVLFGVDAPAGDHWRLGALAGYSRTSLDAGARASSGDADSFHLGVYGAGGQDGLRASFGAAYAWHDVSVDRSVAFAGVSGKPSSGANASTGQVFGELAFRVGGEERSLEPFAGVAFVSTSSEGFTESGGATALKSGDQSASVTFATVGVRGQTGWKVESGQAQLRGSLAWRGASGDTTPDETHAFASGGSAFTVRGTPVADSALAVDADFSVDLSARARLQVIYAGQFGGGSQDNAVKVGLTVGF